MLWKNACRRCAGDLYLQSDFNGQFFTCIQCGALVDHSTPISVVDPAERYEPRSRRRLRARRRTPRAA